MVVKGQTGAAADFLYRSPIERSADDLFVGLGQRGTFCLSAFPILGTSVRISRAVNENQVRSSNELPWGSGKVRPAEDA
jgi:hypothetical protein